jgi:hypothetical protein
MREELAFIRIEVPNIGIALMNVVYNSFLLKVRQMVESRETSDCYPLIDQNWLSIPSTTHPDLPSLRVGSLSLPLNEVTLSIMLALNVDFSFPAL